ncbi:hypothetical protein GCM10010519_27920 [Streptomyces lactacystinicus]
MSSSATYGTYCCCLVLARRVLPLLSLPAVAHGSDGSHILLPPRLAPEPILRWTESKSRKTPKPYPIGNRKAPEVNW